MLQTRRDRDLLHLPIREHMKAMPAGRHTLPAVDRRLQFSRMCKEWGENEGGEKEKSSHAAIKRPQASQSLKA
jgi:hypothetical protein